MLWVKAFHIIFVISWMACIFYLPRLFVNYVLAEDDATRQRLVLMARKLRRFGMTMTAIAIGLGLWLWFGWGVSGKWLHAKLLLVVLMLVYQVWCVRILRQLVAGKFPHGHVWLRWFNEVPAVLMMLIVLLVVLKPF